MSENLSDVSNTSLISHLKQLVAHERELQLEILSYLKEIYERRLYLEKGYPSLFAFMTEELGYSEGAAGRRIRAMKLMGEVPEAKAKLESGALSITVASQIQSFVQNEDKKRRTEKSRPLTSAQKLDLVNQLEGTSSRVCEAKLAQIAPETVMPREQTRILTSEKTQIQFVASRSLLDKLEKLKNLTSHTNPERKYEILFEKLADMALEKLDPERRTQRREKRKAKPSKQAKISKRSNNSQPHTQTQSQPNSSLIHIRGNRPVRSQWPATVGKAYTQDKQRNPDLAPATSAQKLVNTPITPMPSTSASKSVKNPKNLIPSTSVQKLGRNSGGAPYPQMCIRGSLEGPLCTSMDKARGGEGDSKVLTSAQKLGNRSEGDKTGGNGAEGKVSLASRKKGLKRHVPEPLRDYIWRRDQGKCQFKDKNSGAICGSEHLIELGHVFPFSWGGGHSSDILRLLCHWHNLLQAKKYFA